MKDWTDWSLGCEPEYLRLSCSQTEVGFLILHHIEFYGYDYDMYPNVTIEGCEKLCLQMCNSKGFQFRLSESDGTYCYPKIQLLNDKRASFAKVEQLDRKYTKRHESEALMFALWSVAACVIGAPEFPVIVIGWCNKRFQGRDGGIVYKGKLLLDDQVAAIKRLNIDANQAEAIFLAQVNDIGNLNYKDLIDLWGYCVEGKHRLLVYEYVEHRFLAENFSSKALDWKKRFKIAVGTAKGLAYLHEECLEWVFHGNVKPQHILLNSDYQPKVSDFRLSWLRNTGDVKDSKVSRIRGTKCYMAPEWVFNLPITFKVDVYSYVVVLLELLTRRSPAMGLDVAAGGSPTEQETISYMALQWVEEDKDARPIMREVVEIL
ncbi:Kinase superfamily protein [Theobroma cacao]|uniref:Kinase superfamily protein n=1 Tax=Theobroma cacao TaxID=3641 RepID=A0A061DIX7_THECC|nr:Kinase superfamily protein [Theobroma cacao]